MTLSILRRHVYRNTLWTFFIIIFFVLGLWTGKAFASEQSQARLAFSVPERPSKRPEIKIVPSITTTTTTTLKPKPRPQTVASAPVVVIQADWAAQCRIWLTQVGVIGIDQDNAIVLIDRESDCSPVVRNPRSSAGGIPQALPWTKMGCPLEQTNEAALCQIRWMDSYVKSRYGSWAQAVSHSNSKGWY